MDFHDTPQEAAFRGELRSWLAAHAPADLPRDPDERAAALNGWHRALAGAGYVGLSFPSRYGGRGLPPTYEAILNDELGAGGHPPPPAIGHLTNAVRLFGTEAQRTGHLPGMLACTERWCQGFSEPDAGSDLASVRTRAVLAPDGSGWVVTGRKIWTSEAMWSDWCLLLCRTGSDGRGHHGLSMLLVPLDAPGVTRRAITTASGTREFAEVAFDGARVPAGHVLGEPGQGWAIAMRLLGYERGPADIGWVARLGRMLTLLERDIRTGTVAADEAARLSVARAWVALRTLELHVQRTLSARLDGSLPGPEGSLDKLLLTEADQLLNHVIMNVRGAAALIEEDPVLDAYFWSRAQSLFGGTQQIQRTIVAQRLLHLPR
ncbi:alkylation response protein AidB-like acyl-CoA dehydrogenase [Actinocorallia herbida]|uniref:Alkylation response protein AidB-like acyl-CoA dehydrogenase n=1 Tax=Actinocorallia herbida TaxID=58109 RepID=A0A3N1CVV5_9ACTN|nr:acyl-CoA dehydrogenase family protein [Actinocorallia herbida]ROO85384.1 alkylation response protein AidB-like acyl-CoA dehydrogenase [Actinocorallia herbida]